jgi:hypothetical protein
MLRKEKSGKKTEMQTGAISGLVKQDWRPFSTTGPQAKPQFPPNICALDDQPVRRYGSAKEKVFNFLSIHGRGFEN